MIEKTDIKYVNSRNNIYHVPLNAWKSWPLSARQVFNDVYSSMAENQKLFLHPHQDKISKRMWKTTSWNAAWIAALAARDAQMQ